MAKIKVNIFETATTFEPVAKSFSISVSDWILENGKYVAIIQDIEFRVNSFADVFFDENCLEIVSNAKITAEIGDFTSIYYPTDIPNIYKLKFTAENLPTDTISGVYYLFEEESFMAKVRLNSCNTCTIITAEVANLLH